MNARVWTGDPSRPWADALAIRGEQLALVGSSAEVRKLTPATARLIDAKGALVKHGAGTRVAEPESGVLRRGMVANVVVLVGDPSPSARPAPGEASEDARVHVQIVAGRVVYESS